MSESKVVKQISSLVLVLITLIGNIVSIPVSAVSGDKARISFEYCYNEYGDTIQLQKTTSVGDAGEELCKILVEGKEAYCIEPGHRLFVNDELTENGSEKWNSLGEEKQRAIKLALLCGKPGSENALSGSNDEKWIATQLIVWEFVTDCREISDNYNCSDTVFLDALTAGGANPGVKTVYESIVKRIRDYDTIPSFASKNTQSPVLYEMQGTDNGYSLTLTDENHVLDSFDFRSKDGVEVSKSGNTLTLTTKEQLGRGTLFSSEKSVPVVDTVLLPYGDAELQDVITGAVNIPVSAGFGVLTKAGHLRIQKKSDDGNVAGIEFQITGENFSQTVKTNSDGRIIVSLNPGTYTITEKADSRYKQQQPQTLHIEAGKTASVTFNNVLRKGNLKIVKNSEDGIVANIRFTVTGENYSQTVKTNENGEMLLSDLFPGEYTVTENESSKYEEQPPQTVTVEEDKTAVVSFKNVLVKSRLKIVKTAEDGNVSDIEFNVRGNNYNRTVRTNENGEIVLKDLIPGTYTVTESADDRYEKQDPQNVYVEDGKVAAVTFRNVLKKGNLKIVKTSDDGVVENIEFTVTGENFIRTAKTNADGELVLKNLVPGEYTVTETPDERYEEQEPQVIKVEMEKTATVSFHNVISKSNLKIVKVSEDNVVAGIEFTVTGENFSKTVKTNTKGEIIVRELVPGEYTVTEKTDSRYEPQSPKTVRVEINKTAKVTFKNVLRKGDLKIIKTAEDNLVENIEFTVTGDNFSQTVKTNADGEIVLKDLVPGEYTVTETPNERYEEQKSQTVQVEMNKTATVTFKNVLKKGNLKIIKTSDDGVVENIEFTVTGENFSKTVKTNAKGEIVIKDLVPGEYTVTEKTDSRYKEQSPQTVRIEMNMTATVTFKNVLKKGNLKIVKTAEDGNIENIRFTVKGKNFSKTVKSNDKGEITVKGLVPGEYVVIETPDERYEEQEPQTVQIEMNKTATVTFNNVLKKGSLKIVKTSEDGEIANIEFTVRGKDFSKTVKTNDKGEITVKGLVPGEYTVTEVPDERYEEQEPQTVQVEMEKTVTVTFTNVLKKGNLKIIKTSDDGVVENIEFTVTGENFSKTVKTNTKGEIVIKDLVPGEYTVTEKTDSHYKEQSPQIVQVGMNKTATVTFKNVLKKGNLKIVKTAEDGNIENIRFTVKGKNFSKTVKTNDKGEITLKELVPGEYTVTEVPDERYEEQEPQTVQVEMNKTATVTFNNVMKKSFIRVVKLDSETGKQIAVKGAEFELFAPDGKKIAAIQTDEKGVALTVQPLIYGNGYSLVETKAPKGYVLDPTPVYFDVNEKTVSEENGLTVVTVQKFNTVQKGRIVIEKAGEIFANVTALGGGYVDENGSDTAFPTVYQPEFSAVGLAGAVFEIYADEDIVTPNGTLKAQKGELITTITTDENGKAVSQKLYLGKYRITEKTAPYGMERSVEDIQTELIYGGQKKELISVHISVENQRQKAKINLLKVLEQNEIFDIGNNKEINSVKFGLFADEEIKAVNGTVIPKDALLEIISCNEQGNAEFKTNIPFGKYYVREISTEEHYVLSDRHYPVVFEYAGQDTETVSISVNEGKEIVNKIISGKIRGLKTDRENGKAVSGAVFGLFRNDASEFTENNAVMTVVSDENGVFEFNKIPYGQYIVYELQSADGFMKNENRYPVTIAENDCIIEIKVVNDRIPKIRTTATTDGKKEIGASDTFILEDEVAYEHLIPNKEYTLKGVVMDKAINQPMVINGRKIAVEKVFVPETPSGKITVRFRIHATEIKKQTDLVVFETLYDDGQEIAVHCDINDKGQTVTVKIPKIRTTATSDGQKNVTAEKEITIIDTVEYANLIVGKEYRVSGVLMDKKTGRPLTENGKNITSETVFTAEKENGEVTVKFVFDGSVITEDTEVVVFEALYSNNKEIAVHCDINDRNQTITIHPAKHPEIERPKTGDNNRLGMLFGVAGGSLVCILSATMFRKRKWNNRR